MINNWLNLFFEILKLTLPSLIIFLTAYYVLKQFLDNQYQIRMVEYKQNQSKSTLPLRLGAYERLSLLCERISVPNLILRIRTENMTAEDLKIAMMIAIQQEFEHNITQQVYVSDNLWQILKLTRENTITIINHVAGSVPPGADSIELGKALFQYLDAQGNTATDTALSAIKQEAGLLM